MSVIFNNVFSSTDNCLDQKNQSEPFFIFTAFYYAFLTMADSLKKKLNADMV